MKNWSFGYPMARAFLHALDTNDIRDWAHVVNLAVWRATLGMGLHVHTYTEADLFDLLGAELPN